MCLCIFCWYPALSIPFRRPGCSFVGCSVPLRCCSRLVDATSVDSAPEASTNHSYCPKGQTSACQGVSFGASYVFKSLQKAPVGECWKVFLLILLRPKFPLFIPSFSWMQARPAALQVNGQSYNYQNKPVQTLSVRSIKHSCRNMQPSCGINRKKSKQKVNTIKLKHRPPNAHYGLL